MSNKLFDYFVKVAKTAPNISHADLLYDTNFAHFVNDATQDVEEILTQALFDYLLYSTVDVDNTTEKQVEDLKALCSKYAMGMKLPGDAHVHLTFIANAINKLTLDNFDELYVIAEQLIRYSVSMLPITGSDGNYVPLVDDSMKPFTIHPHYHVVTVRGQDVPDIIMVVKRKEASEALSTPCNTPRTVKEDAKALEESTNPIIEHYKDLFRIFGDIFSPYKID